MKIVHALFETPPCFDFDYDEFTDEEYGEWKYSSDTASYMSE